MRLNDRSARAAARALERLGAVRWAEPNLPVEGGAAPTNDPDFGELWGLENTGQTVEGHAGVAGVDVNALQAWDTTRGAGSVVAVVDSGVAADHPDIKGNIWTNTGETPGNGLDDDGNGFVDDVHGWDFWDSDNDPDDFHGHGSHIAGTIAATANNQTGIAGVAPQAKVMPVRVLNEDNRGRTSDVVNGIVYAALNGADIINFSIGTDPMPDNPPSEAEREALDIAAAKDTLVVVAAMNNSKDNDTGHTPTWPCNFTHPNLICVAALDSDGALSDFSNYGATSGGRGRARQVDLEPVASVGAADPAGPRRLRDRHRRSLARQRHLVAHERVRAQRRLLADGQRGRGLHERHDSLDHVVLRSGSHGPPGLPHQLRHQGQGARRRPVRLRLDRRLGHRPARARRELGHSRPVGALVRRHLRDRRRPQCPRSFRAVDRHRGVADGVYIDDVRFVCRSSDYDAESYYFNEGTSMATPHVSGIAALVRSAVPNATAVQVAQAVREGAVALPSLSGKTVTGGRADAPATIAAARRLVQTPPPAPRHRPLLRLRRRARATRTPPIARPRGRAWSGRECAAGSCC